MKNIIDLSDDFERLSRIFSLVPGYILFQDTQAKFLCANALTVSKLGFEDVRQMRGCYPVDVRCPAVEIHDQVVANVRYVVEHDCAVTTLFSAYLSHGHWGLYLGQQQPLRDQSGVIAGVSTHTFDVTQTPMANHLSSLFLEQRGKGTVRLRQGVYKYLDSRQEWNLPVRQGECFFWLLQKKSAKEMSLLLGLSKRTIEYYIELIKSKFNVRTANELIDMAQEKGFANYIPQHWCTYSPSPVW